MEEENIVKIGWDITDERNTDGDEPFDFDDYLKVREEELIRKIVSWIQVYSYHDSHSDNFVVHRDDLMEYLERLLSTPNHVNEV